MPVDWPTLCATVFALGLRHGLDADHLAAIDGMTRFNHGAGRRSARWCGSLFSIGHGAVVIAVAVTACVTLHIAPIPSWITRVGEWASLGSLWILGVMNLLHVLRADANTPPAAIGLQGRALSRLTRTAEPINVAVVGALFALCVDTLSQALLFSAAATRFGGWRSALILGGLFTLAMLLVDGVNGAWLARLLERADASSRKILRGLSLFIALLSLSCSGEMAMTDSFRKRLETQGVTSSRETVRYGSSVLA